MTGRLGRRGWHALVLAALAPVLGIAGCELERRPEAADPFPDENAVPDTLTDMPRDPQESARVTMEVFREAVRVGDLSLALSLLDRDAVLFDDLAGEAAEATTRGELLLELRRRHRDGLRLGAQAAEVTLLDGAAIVVSTLAVMQRTPGDEEELAVQEETARETAILVPTPEGWRIRHLHRSIVPPGS